MMTHAELVRLAAKHARSEWCCSVVLTEPSIPNTTEQPDVLGFVTPDQTYCLDVKMSEADWRADQDKTFRITPGKGMGVYRYYFAPLGTVEPFKIEGQCPGWGLVELMPDGQFMQTVDPYPFRQRNTYGETMALMQAIRNLEHVGARDANTARPGQRDDLTADDVAEIVRVLQTTAGPGWRAVQLHSIMWGTPTHHRWPKATPFRNALERSARAREAGIVSDGGAPALWSLVQTPATKETP